MYNLREELFEIALEKQINMYDDLNKEISSDNALAHEIVIACNEACRDTVRDILRLYRDLKNIEKNN